MPEKRDFAPTHKLAYDTLAILHRECPDLMADIEKLSACTVEELFRLLDKKPVDPASPDVNTIRQSQASFHAFYAQSAARFVDVLRRVASRYKPN